MAPDSAAAAGVRRAARMGRDESRSAQDRPTGWVPVGSHHREHLEQFRRGRSPGRQGRGRIHCADRPSLGAEFPVVQQIVKTVYAAGKGNLDDKSRIGSGYHTLGIINGILNVEALRIAQKRFGDKALSGEQMQWGFDHLDLDDRRIAELGATGLLPPIHVTCADHEGAGAVKFQQWDGQKWVTKTGWIQADRKLLRPLIEASANKYAAEHNITPRNCAKDV